MSGEPAPHQLIASDVTLGRNVQIPAFVNLCGCEIGDETRSLGYTAGALPVAENLAEEFLSLPMFPELTEGQIEYVARCVSQNVGAGALIY
jgi:dTDP-4-amino-4,6-dideoxygalactose transaminase